MARRFGCEQLEDRRLLAVDAGASGAAAQSALVQSEYGQLPLSFEANQGQTDGRVDYLARGAGYTLYLTGNGAVFDLRQKEATAPTGGGLPGEVSGTVIDMRFVGANPSATLSGLDQQQTVSNYFVGADPSQWRSGIANYGQVEYQHLYAGIDAVFHGNQGQLEYDFNIAPGADPNQIQLHIAGASGLSLDGAGNLLIHTSGADLVEKAPSAYQEINGQRVAVAGHFVLEGGNRVGFAIGSYDASLPLVIDPTLSFSTFLGGNSSDAANAIAVDGSASAYLTGVATSTNFPTTPGGYQRATGGSQDAFIAKLSPDGGSLLYSTFLGGSGDESASGIAVDGAGAAFVTGVTSSTNFPITGGAYQTRAGGFTDAFVTKLSPDGSRLVFSTYLGGSGNDSAQGIAIDPFDSPYVIGTTSSTNFPTTPGAFQTVLATFQSDAFVTKLTADGTRLLYSTFLGGGGDDTAGGIAVDAFGAAYVTGATTSTNFPTTGGAYQTTPRGGQDAFVTRVAPDGRTLLYSTYLGGSNNDGGAGIAVDGFGEAFVTGFSSSTNFPTTPGAFQAIHAGSEDAFVAKLSVDGRTLIYATGLGGGAGSDFGAAIAIDGAGGAYVTGTTSSSNFPTTADAIQSRLGGAADAFVSKLSPSGGSLEFSTFLGGTSNDAGQGIAVDGAGNVYVAGFTLSSNFPTTPGARQGSLRGAQNAFVAKFTAPIDVAHTQRFVAGLYIDLLRRPVDAGGLNYWTTVVLAGATRSQVAIGLEQTLEYAGLIVTGLYSRYLHRAADAAGANYFAQLMLQGVTIEQISAVLAGSDEFFAVEGGGTNDGFLNALYQTALGRSIDPDGLAFWNSRLAAGVSRTQVAVQIFATGEYLQSVVQAAYFQLLGRGADAGGVAYWVGQLQAGATDQQLYAAIAGSAEYYAKSA